MAITSAIWNNHWLKTSQHTGITPVHWQTVTTYPSNVQKITGHTNTLTPSVFEINKINIFFRPGRSHVRNWQKLVLALKILVLLERIFDLYTIFLFASPPSYECSAGPKVPSIHCITSDCAITEDLKPSVCPVLFL